MWLSELREVPATLHTKLLPLIENAFLLPLTTTSASRTEEVGNTMELILAGVENVV